MKPRPERRRAALGQNFLNHAVAQAIVAEARLAPGERVYDLGAGSGALTRPLFATGADVIAVERDANLAAKLRQRFPALRVVEADFLTLAFVPPYAVVANPPFNRTAETMRRLFFDGPSPHTALLVLQREAAERYAASARASAVALMLTPWHEAVVTRRFRPEDFVPRPAVDTALLTIRARSRPMLAEPEREAWRAFVRFAFARARPGARQTFRPLLSHLQWRIITRDLAIPHDVVLFDLTLDQWIGLFRAVRRHAPAHRQARIGAPLNTLAWT